MCSRRDNFDTIKIALAMMEPRKAATPSDSKLRSLNFMSHLRNTSTAIWPASSLLLCREARPTSGAFLNTRAPGENAFGICQSALQSLVNNLLALLVGVGVLTALCAPVRAAAKVASPSDYGFAVPSGEPTLPVATDVFAPPSEKAGGPAVAQWTRTASADDVVTVAGPETHTSANKAPIF